MREERTVAVHDIDDTRRETHLVDEVSKFEGSERSKFRWLESTIRIVVMERFKTYL